ncbi:HU family DNA-binding protein [Desulfonatronovibrio hydrogenovorans]|uniref:HU family DNA-binding protein n=1 Tax=Desulfonatronovibrio hydrogenovorans TaxID=53245 RepID=UPI00048E80D0|nr:HU family DNA-binding protein [Desulfonatronovibrio hydrogenovorans]
MNKTELIERVAERTGMSKSQVKKSIREMISVIIEEVQKGEKVNITGFGAFSLSKRQARNGYNPRTGGQISIPARNFPKFKPGKVFKDVTG